MTTELTVLSVFNVCVTDRQTNRPTDGHDLLWKCEDALKKEEEKKGRKGKR